jgi:hypothetical protein
MDADLGLVYLRVPTWSPFRLQFYYNGHSRLARQLAAEGIGFTLADNAFLRIDDWQRAQDLAHGFSPDQLHRVNPCLFASRPCRGAKWRDRYAERCCPVSGVFGQPYHWSLMQVEYATDLAFRSTATLGPLCDQLVRESVLSVKAEQIATFLGRQITPQLAHEIGSQFSTRIEGTCIKHRFGKSSIKMYDKAGLVLRIETTTNDVSFFKHHRKVEHRNGPPTRDLAPVKKSIYSLIDLREILLGCNRRYLAHLSALDDFSAGVRALDRLTKPRKVEAKNRQGDQLLRPGRPCPAACATGSADHHRRYPPLRPDAAAGSTFPGPALTPASPSARHRRDQAGQRHLSLLPHPDWPGRDRGALPRDTVHNHSSYDLIGFFGARFVKSRPPKGLIQSII